MNIKIKIAVIVLIVILGITMPIITYNETTKDQISFYPDWVEKNVEATDKIRKSAIPVINFDVDEKPRVLTIYMTEENANKYTQVIDDLIDVPYEIVIRNMTTPDEVTVEP